MKKRRLHLVKDWKQAHRWFSVQAMALSTAVLATWAVLPEDLKAGIPAGWVTAIACGLLIVGILGRLIDQKRWGR